jgi:hypothetical protein
MWAPRGVEKQKMEAETISQSATPENRVQDDGKYRIKV